MFPLIIIAICVGIFLLFGYLVYDQSSAKEYLGEIRTGSGSARWQAAYELSNIISTDNKKLHDPELIHDVSTLYINSRDDDPRVRRYLALTLGKMADHQSVPALVTGLEDAEKLKTAPAETGTFNFGPSPEERRDAQTQNQIYTLWALGSIGDNAAVPGVLKELHNDDAAVRKTAAYVLGAIKDPAAIHDLQVALNDSKDDVRWNAAMALARLGDAAGSGVLLNLIDRSYLDKVEGMTPELRSELMVNAVKCLGLLKFESARDKIKQLSQSDPDLTVRNAAIEALKNF